MWNRYLFTLDLPEFWENKHADQTLEVLMSDLDPAIMDQFYMKDGVSASDVTRVSLPLMPPLQPIRLPRLVRIGWWVGWDWAVGEEFCSCGLQWLAFVLLQMSGIRDLIPGSVIDATMFNPCGYSMNGMKTDVRHSPIPCYNSHQLKKKTL